jgi:integrase
VSVFKRRGNWYIDYRYPPGRQGNRIREKVGPNKAEAAIRLAERLEEIRHGLDPRLKRIRPRLLEDVVVEFLEGHIGVQVEVVRDEGTIKLKRKETQTCVTKKKDSAMPVYNATLLLRRFDGVILQSITPKTINDFIDARLAAGVLRQTINHQLRLLSSTFKWSIARGDAVENPVKKVNTAGTGAGRQFFLTAEQADLLLEKVDARYRLFVLAALHTTARRGELVKLVWSDLDLERRLVTFRDTKNGDDRTVPLSATLTAGLKALPRPIAGGPVFRTASGSPLTPTIIRRHFGKAVCAAGLVGFRFHDLRHSGASFMVQAGVPLNTVRAILGHKSLSMVLRYAHLAPEHLRDGVGVMDRLPRDTSGKAATGESGPRGHSVDPEGPISGPEGNSKGRVSD